MKNGTNKPSCGLCGKSIKLIKTICCNQWVCDDNDKYRLFTYAHNSCWRNHDRYTVCAFHHHEKHLGTWQTCLRCKNSFDTEDYVDMVTNKYNFEKLKNPPSFKPTKCVLCHKTIVRAEEGFTIVPKKGFVCEKCSPVMH
jgi:hypothetical protein